MANDADHTGFNLAEQHAAVTELSNVAMRQGRLQMAREVKALIGHWGVQKQHLAVIGELLALCSKEGA